MFDRRKFLSLGATTALGAGALSVSSRFACAQSNTVPAGYPADYAKIIEASRQETDLIVYSNMSDSQLRAVLKVFNTAYPWIKVSTLDINGSESIERYFAEVGTNSRTTDLIVTVAPTSWLEMIARKQIMNYTSPEMAAFPSWSVPHPGLYTAAVDPLVFLYNKLLVPEELRPKSFADLVDKVKANPAIFNRKLTSYSAALTSYGYDAHYFFAKHHGDKVWDWYKTVGPQTRFERSSGPIVEKVTTGEYVLAYFCGSAAARGAIKDPARSQVVGMSYIFDGTPMVFRGLAVPMASKNVNSAKLLTDVLLSQQGQIGLSRGSRTPIRPSVTQADVDGAETFASIVKEIGEPNVILVNYDPAMITSHDAFVRRWKEANAGPA